MSKTIRLLIFSLTRWAFSFVLSFLHFLRLVLACFLQNNRAEYCAVCLVVQLFCSWFCFFAFQRLKFYVGAVSVWNNIWWVVCWILFWEILFYVRSRFALVYSFEAYEQLSVWKSYLKAGRGDLRRGSEINLGSIGHETFQRKNYWKFQLKVFQAMQPTRCEMQTKFKYENRCWWKKCSWKLFGRKTNKNKQTINYFKFMLIACRKWLHRPRWMVEMKATTIPWGRIDGFN